MALTAEQISSLEVQLEGQKVMRAIEHANSIELEERRSRLEAVRLAKEVLAENYRNKPVGERELTHDDITAFANNIVTYVKG
jgi:hypothetical protein